MVGPTIIPIKHTIESNCPGCNKKVKAFVIDRNTRAYMNDDDRFQTQFKILGCPECNNVFYKRDD